MGDLRETPGGTVLRVIRDGVLTLSISHPERRNAMTPVIHRALAAAMTEAEADDAVRAIVLTGDGRHFCPGADLTALSGSTEQTDDEIEAAFRSVLSPRRCPKPVIAAVNGACIGVGLALACMADVRIAADSARFGTAFAQRGLVAEYGIAAMLPRLVGRGRALDLLLSSRLVDAEEARAIGLVEAVVPASRLAAVSHDYAADIAANSAPTSLAVIKRQVDAADERALSESVALSRRLMPVARSGTDIREGLDAYAGKRSPVFGALDRRFLALAEEEEDAHAH